jgi:molecular chaperone GrpE (heat shock protein)
MIECEHDLAERESACADGVCPICLVQEVNTVRSEMVNVSKAVRLAREELAAAQQDVTEIAAHLLAHTKQLEVALEALSHDEKDFQHAAGVKLYQYIEAFGKQLRESRQRKGN